jgi:hypothetical protein
MGRGLFARSPERIIIRDRHIVLLCDRVHLTRGLKP